MTQNTQNAVDVDLKDLLDMGLPLLKQLAKVGLEKYGYLLDLPQAQPQPVIGAAFQQTQAVTIKEGLRFVINVFFNDEESPTVKFYQGTGKLTLGDFMVKVFGEYEKAEPVSKRKVEAITVWLLTTDSPKPTDGWFIGEFRPDGKVIYPGNLQMIRGGYIPKMG